MKNILLASLILISSLGFSQTKIYEVPNSKEVSWITRSNGNIVLHPFKSNSVIEISKSGELLNEYKYNHITKSSSYKNAEIISSPDSKNLYILNPYYKMGTYDGQILSKLDNQKTTEVYSELSEDYNYGDIVDVFCDNNAIYFLASETDGKIAKYSILKINHETLEITILAKYFSEKEDKYLTRALDFRYVGQNEASLFINSTNVSNDDKNQLVHSIYEIKKSDGSQVKHELTLDISGNFPLHFNHQTNAADYLIRAKKITYYAGDPSSAFYSSSELGKLTIINDTINIIGVLAKNSNKEYYSDLTKFYSINYDTKSKKQIDSYSDFNNITIETGRIESLASPNKCFSIEYFEGILYFERIAPKQFKKRNTTNIIKGEYNNRKLKNVKFEEFKGDVFNESRYKSLGIDLLKYDVSKVNFGKQPQSNVFSILYKKTFTLYSIK